MSPNYPTDARVCKQCGNGWYARAGHSALNEQHKVCGRCGSDHVETVHGQTFVPTSVQQFHTAAPVVNVNVNVNTGVSTPSSVPVAESVVARSAPAHRPSSDVGSPPPETSSARWWKSPRFWFFALPFATGGLGSWIPPLWVASKVHEGQLKGRLYLAAAAAAVLALIGSVLLGSAPEDALGDASGPRADVGVAILLVAVAIGTGTAVLFRQRVFPDSRVPASSGTVSGPSLLPGVQEAQARRQRRAQYRSLAAEDAALAREMSVGRPDRVPAFDDGGLVDLNALDAAGLERHAGVTAAEAASIVSTRDKLGRLSSVDELVVHGDLTLATAERLRNYAVFIG